MIPQNTSILELSRLLSSGELSSVELTEEYLRRIDEKNSELRAFITVCPDAALSIARESDRRRAEGASLGKLDGIPFAVKDNFCTAGITTTCGSRILENYIPPYDATAVRRLLLAGAVLLGKTNMDEFGMGSYGKNSAYGQAKNPIDLSRYPGGSSGGSAVAVAAGMAPFAIGSDTGGSVRQPAAFCSVTGLKPTYGRVSRYGLVSFASTLDTVGIIANGPEDCRLVLSAIEGKDDADATSLCNVPHFENEIKKKDLRVGIIRQLENGPLSPTVRKDIDTAVKRLAEIGAEVEYVSIPSISLSAQCYHIISSAEASSNLARFDGVRYGRRAEGCRSLDELYLRSRSEGFGKEVKKRIVLGTFALSEGYYDAYYKKASDLRRKLCGEMDAAFSEFDILLSPTYPITPPIIGEEIGGTDSYRNDAYTCPQNLCGLPAISLPVTQGSGIQLCANRLREDLLLWASKNFIRG